MPVSLLEWRVRIGRFVRNPPVINKLEMIKKFLERWKIKKEKAAASEPSTGDQTHCELAEAEESDMAPSPPSTQTQTPSESTKKEKSEMAAIPLSTQDRTQCQLANKGRAEMVASPPSTQDETPCTCRLAEKGKTKVAFNPPCHLAKKGKSKMAPSPASAQDQTPCQSAKKGKLKIAASPQPTQDKTPCQSAKKGKSNMAASPQPTQNKTPCRSAKKGKSKMAPSPASTQDQPPCQSAKKGKLKMAASPPPTQDKTPCQSAKKGKSNMAASPQPTQNKTPCRSAKKGKSNMAASPPSTQDKTPCQSAKKGKSKMAASLPPIQETPCQSAKNRKSKMAGYLPPTKDQTPCESTKKGKSKMAASPSSTQDQTPCQSAKKEKSKMTASPSPTQDKTPSESPRKDESKMEASPLSTQDQTTCEAAKKEKSEMAASSSTQDQIPYKSARRRKSKMAACQPSAQDQIPCRSAKKGKSNMAGDPPSPQDKRLCESSTIDESKMEASPLSTQGQTTCESAKKDRLKTAASPPSLQDQTQSESAKEGRPKMAVSPPCTLDQTTCELTNGDNSNLTASPPSTQDETTCKSAKKGKSEMAASPPSTQTQTPCRSAKKGKLKMAAGPPSTPVETHCTCRLAEKEKTEVAFNPPCDSAGKGKENMASGQTSAQDQAPCKSAKKGKPKMAANEPSTQDQTPCQSAKKGKSKMAVNEPSTRDKTPCKSAVKGKSKMAASPPSPQDETSCKSPRKDESKMEASPPFTPNQTPCESAKKGKSKIAASPSSAQDQTPCQSAKKAKSKMAASPPFPQDETPCRSAKKAKSKMAALPLFPQDQTPCESPRKDESKMKASPPSTQDETPCESTKSDNSKMTASLPSTQDETPCKSTKSDNSKMTASQPSTQDETPCESPRKDDSKMEASPLSAQDETPCRLAKEEKSKMAASPPCESARKEKEMMAFSPPYSQGQTSCELAKADKSWKAASPPSTPHQAPHVFKSTEIEISKNAASQPSAQVKKHCQSTKGGNSRIGPSSKFTEKKESNMAASQISTQDQTQCESAKKGGSKIAASPPSTSYQSQCESSKKENTKKGVSPSSQNETSCGSEKKEKSKMAACSLPSTQDQAPCESAKKEKTKVATSRPSSQICQLKSPSCPEKATLVWSLASTCSCVLPCIAQVLLMVLTLMVACFQLCREQSTPSLLSQPESPAETSQSPRTKVFGPISSCFSCGMGFCRSMISYTVCRFCHLYLPVILLMRSGDVETNPGPNTLESTVSEMEFLKLAQDIHKSSYTVVGTSLGIPYLHLEAILIEKLYYYPSAFMAVFMEWNVKQQPPNNKREVLANALRENDLGDLSERLRNGRLLPKITGGPSRPSESKTKPPPFESETKPLSPELIESTIYEMEFLKLARDIHPAYYTVVGVSLGIPYAYLEAILIEEEYDYPSAFMAVFMKWNVKQQPPNTNKREVLASALRENHLGDLSERLRNERLLPKITGGPSRPPESQTKPPPSESETKPLSPELIEQCANEFKFSYQSSLCKIRTDPLDPASLVLFEDMYTDLFLEKEHGRDREKLDYNDLLDLIVSGQFPKRLMVQGEAGAGKTTLCSKIAWDWIEGKYFKKFVWVLIVHLRDAKQYTLGQIAKSYLTRNNPATACQLAEYIRSHQDKVFIAFDGLDEFSSKRISKSKCRQSHTPLQPSQSRADSSEACGSPPRSSDIRIVDIFGSVELASCPVLVTTRPWRAIEIRSDKDLMKLYTFIHVEGFSRDNLSVYIHKYFAEDNAKAEQLIQFTHENDVISENMAHYPIYVAMLCLMWKLLGEQKLKEIKSLQTFSQIFKEMIGFLKEHYAEKKVEKVGSPSFISCLKEINKLLEPVAKQAFTGLLKNTLVFSDSDFQSCPESIETACRVGILSQEHRITSGSSSGANAHVQLPVFFPHKLFQEYVAGVYLASLYESDRSEFSRLIGEVVLPRKEEFRYLLYFTVSHNKTTALYVMESMIQMCRASDRNFIVDVAFESQDPNVAALVKDKLSSQGMELRIEWMMTAHTVAAYAFTRLPVDNLYVYRDCGPFVSLDVAEMICSIPSLKRVSLRASFHSDFFAVLAQKGRESKVQKLEAGGVKCPTQASSHALAEALCTMPRLNDLTLATENLSDEFYSTLKARSSSLHGCFPQITKGNFRFNGSPVESLESFLLMLSDYQWIISEEEFRKLSELTPPSHYMQVGEVLQISDVQLRDIKNQSGDISTAFMKIFKRWRYSQPPGTNIRALLTEKLKESDLDEVASKVHNKSLISNITAEPPTCPSPSATEDKGKIPQLWSKPIQSTSSMGETDPHDQGGVAVHWEFIADAPEDFILQEDEAEIACGIRFSPSGATFKEPVKVTMEHCAHFTDPSQAEIVFYTRSRGMTSFERIPASTKGYPRCDVRTKDLDLYVDHFCQWRIATKFNEYFKGKRVKCTPYVEPPVIKGSMHVVVLYIYDDLSKIKMKVEEEMTGYKKLHPPKSLNVAWGAGDVIIRLFEGQRRHRTLVDEKLVREQNFYQVSCDPESFFVEPPIGEANQKPLQFVLGQGSPTSTNAEILIVLRYDDRVQPSPPPSPPQSQTPSSSSSLPQSPLPPPSQPLLPSSLQPSSSSEPSSPSSVSQGELIKLAEDVPPRNYTELCNNMGFCPANSEQVLNKHSKDYKQALIEIFCAWHVNQETGNSRRRLTEILQITCLLTLADRLETGHYLSTFDFDESEEPSGAESKHERDDSAQYPQTSGTRQKQKRTKGSSKGPGKKKFKR